ncbi:MAG: hypothetical protein IKW83_00450 [Muribaculaceae bacterium]|nr:hypothetical protein [Muribaculaceae bacterium]
MANLVLASKRETKSGRTMWHVYARVENNKQDDFWFPVENAVKAMRYAFILRSRHNAIIPKAIYGKLMADVQESKAKNTANTEENTANTESN